MKFFVNEDDVLVQMSKVELGELRSALICAIQYANDNQKSELRSLFSKMEFPIYDFLNHVIK